MARKPVGTNHHVTDADLGLRTAGVKLRTDPGRAGAAELLPHATEPTMKERKKTGCGTDRKAEAARGSYRSACSRAMAS